MLITLWLLTVSSCSVYACCLGNSQSTSFKRRSFGPWTPRVCCQVYYIHQLVFLYVKLDSCIIGLLVKALHWGDWVWFEICISYCIGSVMDDVLLGQNCSIFAVKLPSCRKSHQSLCIKIRIKVRSLVSGIFCCHCYNTVTFVMWLAYFRLLPRKCLHT